MEKRSCCENGGGIHDSESAARAFPGTNAIQVATRFVTTKNVDADIRYKEAYLNARKEENKCVIVDSGECGHVQSKMHL